MELGGYFWVVLEDDLPTDAFGDQHMSEIDLCQVDTQIRVLSNRTQFDNSLFLPFDFEHDSSYGNWGLFGGELYFELTVGVGKEDSFGGSDHKLCELEGVGESFGVGVENSEGVLGRGVDCAEAEFVAVGDGEFDGFFVFWHCITYMLSDIIQSGAVSSKWLSMGGMGWVYLSVLSEWWLRVYTTNVWCYVFDKCLYLLASVMMYQLMIICRCCLLNFLLHLFLYLSECRLRP